MKIEKKIQCSTHAFQIELTQLVKADEKNVLFSQPCH